MSLRRNLGLTLTGRQRDGAGLTDRGRELRCDSGDRNKRLLAAFFKDKAQIAEAAKPNFKLKNTPFL